MRSDSSVRQENTCYDVIIVGAGPGGSTAATFLAQRGILPLLLDKTNFPRDKTCGDGLTPQAIYWLDVLGCVYEVLDQTNSCITSCDIFVNSEHILTGRLPQDSHYPGFCTLLERRKLDHLLVRNAISHGAVFVPRCRVQRLYWLDDGVVVEAKKDDDKIVRFRGKLVIGADGVNSIVSRSLGNMIKDGTTAISVRAYYEGVDLDMSPMKIYFDERFFPGYGWAFVDDAGKANIGLGYVYDRNFPVRGNIKEIFHEFVQSDLKNIMKNAAPVGNLAGGRICFYKPRSIVSDRVMLIGDAANLADPLNGGGIHKAMESAYLASYVAAQAVSTGDYSQRTLSIYENLWNRKNEIDWRTGELLLSIAKNPTLREFYLFLLKSVGRLTKGDQRFQDFCGGIFSGVMPQSECLSPLNLLNAVPLDPGLWFSILGNSREAGLQIPSQLVFAVMENALRMAGRMLANPLGNIDWGLEILTKTLGLVERSADRFMVSMV